MEEKNYEYFLKLWEKHVNPIAETYAYCLLSNHFHALVRIKESAQILDEAPLNGTLKTPSQKGFSNFFNAYSKGFNKTYSRTGKLFEERFKRKEVSNDHYFTRIIYYIHSNPQKHGFIDDFRDYPHSSYARVLSGDESMLASAKVLEWFGGKEGFEKYHTEVHLSMNRAQDFEIDD